LPLTNLTSSSDGRSGSLSLSPIKLWWSAWYKPKLKADGIPVETLQNIAKTLLTRMFECPFQWVRSWTTTCKVWLTVAPII
jgi:hypothetical protein